LEFEDEPPVAKQAGMARDARIERPMGSRRMRECREKGENEDFAKKPCYLSMPLDSVAA